MFYCSQLLKFLFIFLCLLSYRLYLCNSCEVSFLPVCSIPSLGLWSGSEDAWRLREADSGRVCGESDAFCENGWVEGSVEDIYPAVTYYWKSRRTHAHSLQIWEVRLSSRSRAKCKPIKLKSTKIVIINNERLSYLYYVQFLTLLLVIKCPHTAIVLGVVPPCQ